VAAKKIPLLEQMRRNPKADWTIDDVARLCSQNGITLDPPTGSSHYTAYSPFLAGQLCIPYKRRIKPFYIGEMVDMIDAHIEVARRMKDEH
jgi:hypothetical protein